MKEGAGNSYLVERLNPEELQKAKEQNLAETGRRSTTRIYTIEQTRLSPHAIKISYGLFSEDLPLDAKDRVKPGTKILIIQRTEEVLSPIEGVYVLGENLKERRREQ
jgi:hypothetical protein